MGKRLLSVDAGLFVAILKETDRMPRTYFVERPLPDDARVVGHEWDADSQRIDLVVESDSWWGDVRDYVDTPYVTVRYGDPEGAPSA